jgi:dolichol-phosphate mannosyltransferase
VLVPTRNEADNVEELLQRISAALAGIRAEILLVDDSDDETPDVARFLARASAAGACGVTLIHREPGPARNGLSGAVVDGLRAATARWVCVMDADLQHPPEVIPLLLANAERQDADLVVASRYALGGQDRGLGPVRTAVSRTSSLAAKTLFPRRLLAVSDPMSGFFLVHRESVDTGRLRPLGFKILVELLVRERDLRVIEVGFSFASRHAGQSKGSLREGLRYLRHLWRLRVGPAWGPEDGPEVAVTAVQERLADVGESAVRSASATWGR